MKKLNAAMHTFIAKYYVNLLIEHLPSHYHFGKMRIQAMKKLIPAGDRAPCINVYGFTQL